MSTPGKIAVVGATGRLGRHLVEHLEETGREVVAISRSTGVDVITGEGLAEALDGVDCIVDAATGASPDQEDATTFFTTAAANLHAAGSGAGVAHIVAVSIIGCDRFHSGYNAAKFAHEEALLSGPIPVSILRAAQFHELVAQMVEWGMQGETCFVPTMRTQPVAARTVAEALANMAARPVVVHRTSRAAAMPVPEIAGPKEESLVAMAELLIARRGDDLLVEAVNDTADPDRELYTGGGLLPGDHATLAGPTYEQWLDVDLQSRTLE
jgi:NAD(P)H-binding